MVGYTPRRGRLTKRTLGVLNAGHGLRRSFVAAIADHQNFEVRVRLPEGRRYCSIHNERATIERGDPHGDQRCCLTLVLRPTKVPIATGDTKSTPLLDLLHAFADELCDSRRLQPAP